MPSAQGLLGQPAGEQPVVQIHLVHFPLPYLFALPCPCLEPLGLALVIALCWSACLLRERANPALLASLTQGVWGISQISWSQNNPRHTSVAKGVYFT